MTLTDTQIAELRDALTDIGYLTDPVLEAIGAVGQRGLARNTTVAAETALAERDATRTTRRGDAGTPTVHATDPLAAAIRLWLLQQPVPAADLSALPLDLLVRAGLVAVDGDLAHAVVDLRPYGSPDDGASGWVASDLAVGLDKRIAPIRPDHVLGVSPASTSLAQMVVRSPVHTALDLGCGCGVQSLHLARHADHVVATDLNPRALALADLSLRLSGVSDRVDLRAGSLYEPVPERFDLIVTNPPYVMSPPSPDGERLVYREGTFAGDGLVESVVRGAPAHLTDGGTLQVLANWADLAGRPWQERLASWVDGTGADLWVLEREHLDVHEYIETWLSDAGLDGSDRWRPRYDAWLAYFDQLGVTGVCMGWITLTMAGRDDPDLSFESWPWQIAQPVGSAIAQHAAGVDAALLPDAVLLARPWALRGDVLSESTGAPGAADPQHVVLRQRTGLCRAVEVGTGSGGVIGACDGELPLGTLVDAVASILEVDREALLAETLPLVRRCLREGTLVAP